MSRVTSERKALLDDLPKSPSGLSLGRNKCNIRRDRNKLC